MIYYLSEQASFATNLDFVTDVRLKGMVSGKKDLSKGLSRDDVVEPSS